MFWLGQRACLTKLLLRAPLPLTSARSARRAALAAHPITNCSTRCKSHRSTYTSDHSVSSTPVPQASVRPAPRSHTDILTCSRLSTCSGSDHIAIRLSRDLPAARRDFCHQDQQVMASFISLETAVAVAGCCICTGSCHILAMSRPHLDKLGVGPRRKDRVRLELRADAVEVQLVDLQAVIRMDRGSRCGATCNGAAPCRRPLHLG